MPPDGPRLPPVDPAACDAETRRLLDRLAGDGGRPLNIFATLAHHPKLL